MEGRNNMRGECVTMSQGLEQHLSNLYNIINEPLDNPYKYENTGFTNDEDGGEGFGDGGRISYFTGDSGISDFGYGNGGSK